jgi:hypothetical protein
MDASMSKEQSMNQTDEQEQAQDHPPSWAQTFGDLDLTPYQPQDQAPPPGPRSSAARHSARVREGERQAREARQLAQLQADARERLEDEALVQAQQMTRAGRRVPADIRELASAALARRGVHVPSSETLAAPTLARLRREAQEQDRRRAGRRPRS